MRNISITICLFIFLLPAAAGQENYTDSLRKAYLSAQGDSAKAWNHIVYLSELILDSKADKQVAGEFLKLHEETAKTGIPSLLFWSFYLEGYHAYSRFQYMSSIIALEKAKLIAEKQRLSASAREEAGRALITLGLDYSATNDPDNAHRNYQQAIRVLQEFNDSLNITLAYLDMGYLFLKSRNWEAAVKVFEKSVIYMNRQAQKDLGAILFASLSTACTRSGKLKESAGFLIQSAGYLKDTADTRASVFYLDATGEYQLAKKDYKGAIQSFELAVQKGIEWGDSVSITETFEKLGRAYWKSGDQVKAALYFGKCDQQIRKYNLLDQRRNLMYTLFDYYKSSGQFEQSAGLAEKIFLFEDSLSGVLNNNRRIIMQAVFDADQQSIQITDLQQKNVLSKKLLRQKNWLNIILAVAIIFFLLVAGLVFRNYRQQQKIQCQKIAELEKEKQLSATQSLLRGQEEERNRMAQDLHDGLGGLLSGVKLQLGAMKGNLILSEEMGKTFNNALSKLDDSINEMRRVAHNMMPEALLKLGLQQALQDYCDGLSESGACRITGEFHGLEIRMDASTEVVVYRIVQELLNNAVKHSGADQVLAQVMRQEQTLTITVEDNGKGFDPESSDFKSGAGFRNIRSRVDYLKGQLDIQSAPGKGTSIHIDCIIENNEEN